MTEYYVKPTTSIVDGSSYTPDDTIIIRGGVRGNLLLKNFDGEGSYIPIINENGTPKVEISGVGEAACLNIKNCKYIDLRGNNDSGIPYGIKVICGNTSQTPGTIWLQGESDHIKLGYLEGTCEGNTSISGIGIFIQDGTLTKACIWDSIEIHHNYIHDTRYAGMYLGQNDPDYYDNPYLSNVTVYNNILEDLGAYGITLKGIHADSGVCSIYNNIVRPSNRGASGGSSTGLVTSITARKFGIGGSRYYGSTYANIYNNWIEKTVGNGIQMGDQNHQIYNNTICGCGSCNEKNYGHGIMTQLGTYGIRIFDNVIIQPKRYGFYNVASTTGGVTLSRNLIGDAGIGEWGESQAGDTIESSGADANVYYDDVANFNFKKWTNDRNYYNDDFSFITEASEGSIVSLNYPLTVQHGATVDIDAAIKNIGELSGLFKMQLWRDGVLKATSPQFILASGETSTDKINPFTAPASGASMAMAIKCIRTEE